MEIKITGKELKITDGINDYVEKKLSVTLKNKDTLDGLDGLEEDNSDNGSSQVVPWGGSSY